MRGSFLIELVNALRERLFSAACFPLQQDSDVTGAGCFARTTQN